MGSSNTPITDSSASASESDGSTSETASDTTQNLNDAASCPFSEGEKVLASHGPFFYEAKVMRIMGYMNKWNFFVHYHGWNKNWDEWVGADRLMPYTEENVQKHLAVNKKREMDKTMKLARSSNLKEKMVVRGKKRRNDDHLFMDNIHVPMRKYAKIKIPARLKKHLVDCEVFTRMGKLVRLPRSPNVNDIFDRYLRHRKREDESLADSLQEVMKGLQSYFDKALPVMLLYRIERRQYEEAIADDVTPSDVYGAEHLLRLFVKLPELLYYAEIEEETFAELMQKVNDFLKWLRTNQRAFFRWDYYAAKEIQRRTNKRDD